MFKIIRPEAFIATQWKNGGGVTREVARRDDDRGLLWRLSIADVASDGPFSRFDGLSRILTVIDGAGLRLAIPDGVLMAPPLKPVAFAGDVPVDCTLIGGAVRDFNLIYDATRIGATVTVTSARFDASEFSAVLALTDGVLADGTPLPIEGVALGHGQIRIADGGRALRVTLIER